MNDNVMYLDVVDSTNSYAKQHFPVLPDGLLIAAHSQTAGRGRLGRKWLTTPGTCITASFVMKNINDIFIATCVSSLAVLDLLRSVVPQFADRFYIKWPNDIYFDDAKVAGILCEGVVGSGHIVGIIAGMGINVNLSTVDLAAVDQRALSLCTITKEQYDVKNLTALLAKTLNECYIMYSKFPERIFDLWCGANKLIGKTILFDAPDGKRFKGTFKTIRRDGSIEVESGGDLLIFSAGDVRVVKGSWL